MSIMDPLLNTGFLWHCLAAYTGVLPDNEPIYDPIISKTGSAPEDTLRKQCYPKTTRSSLSQSTHGVESAFQQAQPENEDNFYARLSIHSFHLSIEIYCCFFSFR